ncbi:hypothetical protein LINPERPRIM_LOCUS30707, partial [Linum perenne]
IRLNQRCPTLTDVLFADDTILFGEASVFEATTFLETVERYGRMTGQTIIHQKFSIMFSQKTQVPLQH